MSESEQSGDLTFGSMSLPYVEGMYEQFLQDAQSVDPKWQAYFGAMGSENGQSNERTPSQRPFASRSIFNPPGANGALAASNGDAGRARTESEMARVARLQERVDQLIRNYRVRGHILAQVDPLGQVSSEPIELDPEFYGFKPEDYDRQLSTSWVGGPEVRTVRGIVQWLRQTYCRSIGVQFMHIDSLRVRRWLIERMETTGNRVKLARSEQMRILRRLADAVVFEEFLAKKFVGAKSFSLEGAESLIPLLDLAIEKCGRDGIKEIVIGMAHRGRLNVLANIMGKSPRQIFREFEDKDAELYEGRGDVKYHLGYSYDWVTSTDEQVHLSLCFNPSHLEFVNTVAQGRMRAKQDRFGDFARRKGTVILIHGDAAFAGEGTVQETLNLSELAGYDIGGTIHVVVNNQIGFTTPPSEARSSTYATDVAKMLQSPIFHVNGEDPEAVAQVVNLALDFRREFKRDVVIDMYCYRRHGHNEGDEPQFTQPAMYKLIQKRQSVYDGYLERLLNLRGISASEADAINEERREFFEKELEEARRDDYIRCVDNLGGVWSGYKGGGESVAEDVDTTVAREKLTSALHTLTQLPEAFTPHPKIERFLKTRQEMAKGERPLDWGTAEALAFATLLEEGHRLRLSGQDVERGTFSHRHMVLHDYNDGHEFKPLGNIAPERGRVEIYNSPLSETGVLGFDYGYSLDCPDGLVIWEAQFGDFCNAAQVIIDQFITSAEDKWARLSGLVMLLPHGFEGQGPEHSSARLERFLALAAEDNIQVVNATTPAQYFHVLRRQTLRKWKKPLIMMTPKSLLRHPRAVSSLDECTGGRFRRIIDDETLSDEDKDGVRKILLCSGKVYYDLLEYREQNDRHDVALLRIEELYPLPIDRLQQVLRRYPQGVEVTFVQEEPANMGAWRYLRVELGEDLFGEHPFSGITRPASASPATGSSKSHKQEQATVIEYAFGD